MKERGQVGFYGAIFLLAVAVVALALSATPVKFGTVKAITFAGGLTGRVVGQGLNWKWPWQGTQEYIIQVRTYEVSENPNTSLANFTDFEVPAQTSDGQQITVSYTVKFQIASANVIGVLEEYGPMAMVVENIVKADSRSEARKSAQNYEAGSLYSGSGILLYEGEVEEILRESFARADVQLVQFLIRKISFSQNYVDAIEAKQIAAENVVTQQNNARAAMFERDRQITLAEGEAGSDIKLAEAQAQAITLQGEALRQYPEIIQWEFVRNLEGVQWGFLPSDGIVPLLPIGDLINK